MGFLQGIKRPLLKLFLLATPISAKYKDNWVLNGKKKKPALTSCPTFKRKIFLKVEGKASPIDGNHLY